MKLWSSHASQDTNLTYQGNLEHIKYAGCIFAVANWGIITGSGNGLSPTRRQTITWTSEDLLYPRSTEVDGAHTGPSKYVYSGLIWKEWKQDFRLEN